MEKELIGINLSIPNKMKEWLDEHPEINKSDLFRKAVIRKKRKLEEQVSPLFALACYMGVLFGVAIGGIGIGISSTFMNVYIRGCIVILGATLALVCFVAYTVEKRKVKYLKDEDLE